MLADSPIWHPFTPYLSDTPILITKAKGCKLFTKEERAILDGISSWWVTLHEHAHEYITEAIYKQSQQLEQVIFAGFTHEQAQHLAQRLLSILPNKALSKVFFSDDGSTAVEVALKMTFQYFYNQDIHHKKKVIAFEGAYHGDTFGAMSVGERSPFNAPYVPYLFETKFIPLPNCENFSEVFETFCQLAHSQEVAAFIFEPLIQGAGGMRIYQAEYLDSLIQEAHKHGIVCIADEVMTGFGRTGELFASSQLQHQPDIFCLSKGLTGGFLPLGVTVCADFIYDAYRTDDFMKTFFHGHSFTANPLACAAANASLDLLLTEECYQKRKRIHKRHTQFLQELQRCSAVENVRCIGTIAAFDVKTAEYTSYVNEARGKLYAFFINRNVLLRPLGNVVYILPPYNISDDELDTIYDVCLDLAKNPNL
ncbi:MAG: adenosylmethionine--8-amino-7-oxononanoate transaminase [Cytophagales bacterium]|nr:adenosylmethionine--8-amino-7-oxononanoate transaminase [Cytophagales bacterium]MDW8384278.1 adenosylmethionine--8-amino-7-oxononanoate transaminase [Flammeovirgaceae bacterium]